MNKLIVGGGAKKRKVELRWDKIPQPFASGLSWAESLPKVFQLNAVSISTVAQKEGNGHCFTTGKTHPQLFRS